LRAKRLGGVKFVRQHPIGPYFADFACRSRMIVIEVDGATHGTDAERAHDRKRTAFLQQLGYRVLRFGNDEVLNGMDGVLSLVSGALSEAPSPPRPVPGPP
jgi:very-short-patch-repair endonuclease